MTAEYTAQSPETTANFRLRQLRPGRIYALPFLLCRDYGWTHGNTIASVVFYLTKLNALSSYSLRLAEEKNLTDLGLESCQGTFRGGKVNSRELYGFYVARLKRYGTIRIQVIVLLNNSVAMH